MFRYIKDLLLQLNDLMAASDGVAIPHFDIENTEHELSPDQELNTLLSDNNSEEESFPSHRTTESNQLADE